MMLEHTRLLVECESPSSDLDAVRRVSEAVAEIGTDVIGREPERLTVEGCSHLRWTSPRRTGGRVLLLGHYDTVWPHGSLAAHPFTVEDGVVRGPGSFDMKVGVVMAIHAMALVAAHANVDLLLTGDEEIGSLTSRALIEATAAECSAVLVLEGAAERGALKTQRKGISQYTLEASGRAAHAGLEPEKGINATLEIAHQVFAVSMMDAAERGTSVVPTALQSGTTLNTVPANAELSIDVRAWDRAEQERVDRALRALSPALPGARLHLSGGPSRAPLEQSASASLFEVAQQVARDIGIGPLAGAAVGGGSDGNFTAGIGVATLDGLGAVGGGAHAVDEHVILAEVPRRTALVAGIVERIGAIVDQD
ncbi:M20 family metallopeptidase [Microbacterium sp. NIBRBAC000506063]|uniref:M20 family metallopeptidase n=1 Tax=Microbacterium sp. NIBRBAC000506063 TaxID=2734618 RepID=UPI001BB5FCA7|nr:M20 family metallopeptidase [Microbacterium sp. NIBRBAC000506063]QTV79598.1 M20 family metallopeptidase [Microbacterium sp. NIBRBAC000506063]